MKMQRKKGMDEESAPMKHDSVTEAEGKNNIIQFTLENIRVRVDDLHTVKNLYITSKFPKI